MDKNGIQSKELNMLLEINEICKKYDITYYLAYGSVLGAVRHKGFIPWDSDIDIMVKIEDMDKFLEKVRENISEKYKLFYYKKDPNYDSLKPRVGLSNKTHHKIHIDIFPMIGLPQNNINKIVMQKLTSFLYKAFFLKKFNSSFFHKKNFSKIMKHRLIKLILLPIPIKIIKKLYNYIINKFPTENSESIYNICGSYGKREIIPKKYLGHPKYMNFEGHEFPIPEKWDEYLIHIYGNDYMTPKKY